MKASTWSKSPDGSTSSCGNLIFNFSNADTALIFFKKIGLGVNVKSPPGLPGVEGKEKNF